MTWIDALAGAALVFNLGAVASVLRRLIRLSRPQVAKEAATTLILPLTGRCPDLEELFDALDRQTLRPRRLVATVESEEDPAHERVLAVAPRAGFPVEVVVAGEASRQAQKCRNQQAALERIDGRDEVIVLLDADIRPRSWWLSALVSPIADGTADLVSGQRWLQVTEPRLGSHLVTAIDRSIMLLPRFEWRIARAVWGGSLALSPQTARRIDLSGVLSRAITDDLAIAHAAAEAELRVLTRGALLVPSPIDLGLAAAFRFGKRQYQIGHLYLPTAWRIAVALAATRLAAWLILIGHALFYGTYGLTLLCLAALAAVKQALVAAIASRLGQPDPGHVFAIQIGLGPLQVVVDAFNLAILVAAARTSRMRWGHVDYAIAAGDDVRVIARRPPA